MRYQIEDETTRRLLDPTRVSRSEANAMESLDYDTIDSHVYLAQKKKLFNTKYFVGLLNFKLWVVTFLIGFLTGIFGVALDFATKRMIYWKILLANRAFQSCHSCFWFPYVVILLYNVVLVALSSAMVLWFAPAGGGSGIPEVKCYLNGIKVPQILRLRTLFVKAVGVILTVAGGLACGNEGPMIHIGSMIAAGISQGKSSTIPFLDSRFFSEFRNDHDKRDFVSSGAAAGIAGAFGAPVGGTLFSLEEGSSFWNQALTWRTFFCAFIASLTLNTFLDGISTGLWSPDDLSPSFSIPSYTKEITYTIPHLPFFILMGVFGGLIGALFNKINELIMKKRKKYLNRFPFLRWIESILIATITATVSFSATYFFPGCRVVDENFSRVPIHQLGGELVFDYTSWYCPPGEKNEMANLFLGSGEIAVKSLLHDNIAPGGTEDILFPNLTLTVYSICYYFLAVITLGISASSGLLVPCLAIGGAYGRLFGQLIYQAGFLREVNLHTFALIGAASFLGGAARMTIALCVILIETTGSVQRGLPIMVTLMAAKWVGDWFGHGIYDIHIKLKKIPLLEWDPDHMMSDVRAEEIMADHVIWFYEVEKVGKIHLVLLKTTHNGFPVVSKDKIFQGLILRSQLVTLLHLRAYQTEAEPTDFPLESAEIDFAEFNRYYPRFPGIESVHVLREDANKYINIRPYMNLAPFVIQKTATVDRVFRLFRTMGLRHLPVINEQANVVGMITRRDLLNYKIEKKSPPLTSINENKRPKRTEEEFISHGAVLLEKSKVSLWQLDQ